MIEQWAKLADVLGDVSEKHKAHKNLLLGAAKAVIQSARDEGWIYYKGTDESRLALLENAVAEVEREP